MTAPFYRWLATISYRTEKGSVELADLIRSHDAGQTEIKRLQGLLSKLQLDGRPNRKARLRG